MYVNSEEVLCTKTEEFQIIFKFQLGISTQNVVHNVDELFWRKCAHLFINLPKSTGMYYERPRVMSKSVLVLKTLAHKQLLIFKS